MTSYDFDERLSALERGHNAPQIGFDSGEQGGTARVAKPSHTTAGPPCSSRCMAKSSSYVMMAAPTSLA